MSCLARRATCPGHVGRAAHLPAARSYHVTAAETNLARGSAPAIADVLMARTAQLLRDSIFSVRVTPPAVGHNRSKPAVIFSRALSLTAARRV
jgi:hypothetical protein